MSDFPDWTDGISLISTTVPLTDLPDWSKGVQFVSGAPPFNSGIGPIAGQWYTTAGYDNFATSQFLNGTMSACPFDVSVDHTFTAIGVGVNTGGSAGSVYRLGIYTDSNVYPGSLVADYGTVPTTAQGAQTIAISAALAQGRYWLAAAAQGSPVTLAQLQASSVPATLLGFSAIPINATMANESLGVQVTGITGALPATFPGGGSFSAGVQAVWLKA